MKGIRAIGVCVCFALVAPGTSGHAEVVDGVAAHVNNMTITIGEVRQAMAGRLSIPSNTTRAQAALIIRKAYKEALEDLISRQLIIDEFEDSKLTIPEQMIDEQVASVIDEKFDDNRSALMSALAEDGVTFDEWREVLKERMIVSAMRSEKVGRHVSVSPEDVHAYYKAHRDEYQQSAATRIRLIVLRPEPGETMATKLSQARALRQRIAGGESFGSVAREFSVGTEADAGGDRGWINPRRALRKELADGVETLGVGEISDVVKTPEELYLVKKEAVREAAVKPLGEVAESISRRLRREQSVQRFDEWVKRLRDTAYVRVFDPDKLIAVE